MSINSQLPDTDDDLQVHRKLGVTTFACAKRCDPTHRQPRSILLNEKWGHVGGVGTCVAKTLGILRVLTTKGRPKRGVRYRQQIGSKNFFCFRVLWWRAVWDEFRNWLIRAS